MIASFLVPYPDVKTNHIKESYNNCAKLLFLIPTLLLIVRTNTDSEFFLQKLILSFYKNSNFKMVL